jgi:ABC-type branched-subunit amino acid transport system ATPase component
MSGNGTVPTTQPGPGQARSNGASSRGHLVVKDARVSYDGLRALDGVSLEVAAGGITGLIGPNGSGKTTFLNVVSGAQLADRAEVELDGKRIEHLAPHRRARAGVARTFQSIRLFETLTVIENVMLGATRKFRSTLLESVIRSPREQRERRAQRERAEQVLSLFGDRLLPRVNKQVATLSYANRRRVEISRALMLGPRLLLFDEPTAGMNPHETWEMVEQIPRFMAMCDCSVMLVEHKMDVITALCRHVVVLDHGECLAQGDPRIVQNDPAVAEAFLGVE